MPHALANSCNTISQAPVFFSSLELGNFAIHKFPLSSTTLAFGLAPPNDDPGSINRLNHWAYSGSFMASSRSSCKLACSNSRRDVQGGVAIFFWSFMKGPSSLNLKRTPPIRWLSKTPNKKSLSESVLSARCSFFACHASRLRINSLPQRSGDESRKIPKLFFSSGK